MQIYKKSHIPCLEEVLTIFEIESCTKFEIIEVTFMVCSDFIDKDKYSQDCLGLVE